MRHLSALIIIGFVALAAPASAHAGGYIGFGIGTSAKLHGNFADHFDASDSMSGRLTLGKRTGAIAIEGSIFNTDLRSVTQRVSGINTSLVSAEVALKYHFELQKRLEGYVRGGLSQTWIVEENQDFMSDTSHSGSGYSASVGLQYNLNAVLSKASIWLDYTHTQSTLTHSSRAELEGGTRTLSIGLQVGF